MTTSTGPQWPATPTPGPGAARAARTASSGRSGRPQAVPGPLAASVAQEGARRRRRRGAVLVVVLAVATWYGMRWAEDAFAGSQGDPSAATVPGRSSGDTAADGSPDGGRQDDGGRDEGRDGGRDGHAPADDDLEARLTRVVDELTAAGIDRELSRRYARADAAAAAEGVELVVTSGRRSAAEQRRLFDEAVERYGSEREARRWVLPADRSAHVAGTAIDVGRTEGALWLGEHGQEYGLCRVYANEIWHFEAMPDGADRCPQLLPDSSSGW
ncbi:M15 family metallopeptidase [Cellulomonas uda]|uniref:M15 family metallopeptidase n=1 Tax=Cellulomonas uda TaxID=1714 RepID=UPI001ABA2255|nr:M15 family metallopeptidase [Cellulomonas uda]NII66159.1 hypothetical protein [Cellulomonas uda]